MVDLQDDRPVYQQIAERLRSAITSGVLQPGAQLPSEHELVAEYGVSRGTARQAIMLLRNEGLIDVVHGLGSFVREHEPIVRLGPDRLTRGWDPEDDPPDHEPPDDIGRPLLIAPDERTLRFDPAQPDTIRVSPEIASTLGVSAGAEVFGRRWEDMRGERVLALMAAYVPWDVANAAGLAQTTIGPAMYAALADRGYPVVRVSEEVQARMPTAVETAELNISDGVPVMSVQRVSYTTDDEPIAVSVSVMSAAHYRLVYELEVDD